RLLCIALIAQAPGVCQKPVTGGESATSEARLLGGKAKIGPDDTLKIEVFHGDELSKTWRVNSAGDLNLPLVGKVKAAGLTVEELETNLAKLLEKYINEPRVSIFMTESRSQPVTVLGAVAQPGRLQIKGEQNTLFNLVNEAGGPKDAGATLTVTRPMEQGQIPLDNAKTTPDSLYSVAKIPVSEVMSGQGRAANLEIRPRDVVTVDQKQPRLVYVIGEVVRPGSVELVNSDTVSITKVLAAAGGKTKTALASKSLIRHIGAPADGAAKINLDEIMSGKASDLELSEGDVLVVPSNQLMQYLTTVSMVAVNAGIFAGFQVLARY
ncbi:MAG TPA: polysaccharide biosynthesis/export family protein, partial [Bryobacteraceae bacterium]|nr:polysaccharide biosynthesis/export family protein [Bryobacteraceae bacterium]